MSEYHKLSRTQTKTQEAASTYLNMLIISIDKNRNLKKTVSNP